MGTALVTTRREAEEALKAEVYENECAFVTPPYDRYRFYVGYMAALQGPTVQALVSALEEARWTIHSKYCGEKHHPVCDRSWDAVKSFKEI